MVYLRIILTIFIGLFAIVLLRLYYLIFGTSLLGFYGIQFKFKQT